MTDDKRALKVFLCHAHSDKDAVKALYARLKREGVDVWLDKEKLLPGADWELEIRKAVREADVVVVCLSKQFNQAGFRQKEVRIALEEADKKPSGEIFIIPARLEECDNLESLSKWHWVDLFESDGYQRLLLALRVRADKIGAALRQRRGGHATISRPKIKDEQEAAGAKAKLEADELEKQKAAKEQADREKAEKDAVEKACLEAEEAEKQRLAREAAEKAAREKAEQDVAEKARLEAEELERQQLANEKADHEKVEEPKPVSTQKPSLKMIAAIAGVIFVFIAMFGLPWKQWLSVTPDIVTVTPANMITFTIAPTKTPTKAFTPIAMPYPAEITDNGVPMRLVPAGEFSMGSEKYDDEKPIHQVYLDDFYMDAYEVTNAFYKACVDAGGCTPPQQTKSFTRSSYYGNSEFDDYPVIYVEWNQAKAYCEWRGARLPTEAEWEKAARGTGWRTYPWGEEIDCDKANYSSCKGDTTQVGSYESGKSPYSIYDLAGNVCEWTADWYSETYYQYSPSSNPLGTNSGQYRVLRGGTWFNVDYNLRASYRLKYIPNSVFFYIGFRCVRSLP